MKYSQFEQVTIGVAFLGVLALLATTIRDPSQSLTDIATGVLLVAVLAAAVHFGRRGGLTAAIAASAAYIVLNIPAMTGPRGLVSSDLFLMVMRVAAFGLIGIVGGEACSRFRQFLTRFANAETFDEWSHAFNERYAVSALQRALGAFERYQQPFSLVLVTLCADITANMGPHKVRTLIRGVSAYLRADLRMVDELARLRDGRYFVLLPHTNQEGGQVVADRLLGGLRELLGSKPESVRVRCLSATGDAAELWGLLSEMASDSELPVYPGSGAYSSAGASALKPPVESALSAPGPSTLNMSTAAAPDGSTKQ